MMQLLGWTLNQWGAAKAEYCRITGADLDGTFSGAVEVQEWWESHRLYNPMETRIIGADKIDVDFRWAANVFKLSSGALRG